MSVTLIKMPAVTRKTTMCKSQVYQKVAAGEFPKPINLGSSRCVAWLESEVDAWIEQKAKAPRVIGAGVPARKREAANHAVA